MAKKRKISVRKILRAFVTLVVTTGCIVAVLGASKKQKTETIGEIILDVKNDNYKFLDKEALWNETVVKNGLKEGKTRLGKLDIRKMERQALKNQWVAQAEVFVDNNRDVHINVSQHVPVARMFFDNGQSCYLDGSLRLLPLSDLFTYYTTIVTNVPVLSNDSMNRALRGQIVQLVKFVERDSFWSAQIAQISVTPDLKFELTPVLGTHKIVFGDTTDMHAKFSNLFAFYRKVLNRVGWDRYDVLDVRYKDQVVASPSIPWKPPSKNALSNMDWVKSIMGDAPKDSAKAVVAISAPKPVQKTAAAPVAIADNKPKKKDNLTDKKKESTVKKEKGGDSKAPGKYIYQGNTNR